MENAKPRMLYLEGDNYCGAPDRVIVVEEADGLLVFQEIGTDCVLTLSREQLTEVAEFLNDTSTK